MAQKRGVPGSKKGQAKPPKRVLDPQFKARLIEALGNKDVPEVAKAVGCTTATLYSYLRGGKKMIEALLLFCLADYLEVSARWLATGQSRLTRHESVLLKRYRASQEDEKVIIDGLLDRFASENRK